MAFEGVPQRARWEPVREPYFVRSRGGSQDGRWNFVLSLPYLQARAHQALETEERRGKRRRAAEAREKEERDEGSGRGSAAGRHEEDTQAEGRGEEDERARQQLNGNGDGEGPSQWGEATLRRRIE